MADDLQPLAPQPPNPGLPPQSAQDMVRALLGAGADTAQHFLELPKQIFEQSENLRQTGQYDPSATVEMGQLLAGGALPAAERGAAGVFGGRLAQTANLSNLYKAKMVESQGYAPYETFRQTGWFRGPDNQWRFEIPDSAAKLHPNLSVNNANLGNVLDHPDLYKAYPDLAKVPVKWTNDPSYWGAHYPHPGQERFTLNPTIPSNEFIPTALHEAQHAIQWREGFSPGTHPNTLKAPATKAIRQLYAERGLPLGKDRLNELLPDATYEAYLAHAGEDEANNVGNRYASDFYGFHPESSSLHGFKDQIVRPPIPNSPYEALIKQLMRNNAR